MILNDQVAMVTGAGQGIGKACALALAEAGAHVVAVDINAPNAEATAEAAAAFQRRSLAIARGCRRPGATSTGWCARRWKRSAASTSW